MVGSQITIRPTVSSISGAQDITKVVITALDQNEFVATWTQKESGPNQVYDIVGQIFSGTTGQTIGSQFAVETGNPLTDPHITSLANDKFLSSWTVPDVNSQSQIKGGRSSMAMAPRLARRCRWKPLLSPVGSRKPVSPTAIFMPTRLFERCNRRPEWRRHPRPDIRPLCWKQDSGPEFNVNSNPTGDQTEPAVAVLPDGSFVVSWTDNSGGHGLDIKLQHFDQNGSSLGVRRYWSTRTLTAISPAPRSEVLSDNELLVTCRLDSSQATPQSFVVSGIDGQLFKFSSVPAPAIPTHNDIDRDGQSDLILHNDNGSAAVWEMNGPQVKFSTAIGTTMTGYDLVGTGDIDGDRQTDLLFRDHSSGYVVAWEMNGTTVKLAAGVGPLSTDFTVAGTGDRKISRQRADAGCG